MRVALCTTTINIPHVLKLYRACDPDVKIFIALDDKTPIDDLAALEITNFHAMRGEDWKCSPLIGWNSIQRRNIAFLEALKWGAEVIVSIDDDNIPLGAGFTQRHSENLGLFNGLMVHNESRWFDVGSLLSPPAKHRGFPANIKPRNSFYAQVAHVGVNAGACLGDPDVDAVTRIALAPDVHQVSQLLDVGVVVSDRTWTVFNSQNTSIFSSLIPAWGMIPFVGRMDDIYASLIVQRVMRERASCVRFGRPYAFQQRNEHNLIKDLRGELDGYENVTKLATLLDNLQLAGQSVIADCRRIWETLNHADWMPGRSVSAMMAYIDDCEAVL